MSLLFLLSLSGASLAEESPVNAAIEAWSDPAPIVARVTAISVDSRQVRFEPGIISDVVLRVDRVLRDDTDSLGEGELIDLVLPGGEIGDTGVLTFAAPIFREGDEGLVRLVSVSDGTLWPQGGNDAFLAAAGGVMDLCVAPGPTTIGRCAEEERLVLPGPKGATFAWGSLSLTDLDTLAY